jgi:glycosyltransferase involved in cell wall biosynthesis
MITLIIPTIPPRKHLLTRALHSVAEQTLKPEQIIIQTDWLREGAAATRNKALEKVSTPLVAFMDDDDTLEPDHLARLHAGLAESGADVVYPWYTVVGGTDPRPDREGKPFDADELRRGSYITVNCLVKSYLAKQAGFHVVPGTTLDDWGFYLRLLDMDAEFHHVAYRTFNWYHWMNAETGRVGNTSGQPDRW